MVIAGLLASGSGVFGQTEVTKPLVVNRDGKIGGQTISKGTYEIRFVDGKDGEAVVTKGKKEMLKLAYKTQKLEGPAANTIVVYKAGSDGSFLISRVEFKGSDIALVFE
jgi:hypothetical protein